MQTQWFACDMTSMWAEVRTRRQEVQLLPSSPRAGAYFLWLLIPANTYVTELSRCLLLLLSLIPSASFFFFFLLSKTVELPWAKEAKPRAFILWLSSAECLLPRQNGLISGGEYAASWITIIAWAYSFVFCCHRFCSPSLWLQEKESWSRPQRGPDECCFCVFLYFTLPGWRPCRGPAM